jgi:hypothetical protein
MIECTIVGARAVMMMSDLLADDDDARVDVRVTQTQPRHGGVNKQGLLH